MTCPQFQMENVACPLCGSADNLTFRQAPDRLGVADRAFTLVRCAHCGLVYQNPRVTPATIGVFYPDDYYKSRAGRQGSHRATVRKLTRRCQLVETFSGRKGTLLDIGSANGDFLVAMRKRGWQVRGVEPSSDAAQFSRHEHGLNVFHGETVDRPDDGERFDVVTMWAVLPHIPDPVPTISRVAQVLAPRGKLIICCANIDSYAAQAMGDNWGHLDLPRHYTMWSPHTLKHLLQSSGIFVTATVHHDDIYKSQLKVRWLAPLIGAGRSTSGMAGFCYKVVRKFGVEAQSLLTKPVLAIARAAGQGGIITVVGEKR